MMRFNRKVRTISGLTNTAVRIELDNKVIYEDATVPDAINSVHLSNLVDNQEDQNLKVIAIDNRIVGDSHSILKVVRKDFAYQ